MIKPEILSPAGSFETLKAAVLAGADAVYFGGQSFNARRNAANFSDEDLEKAVSFCHQRGVKAYITFNTLVFNNEMRQALEFTGFLAKIGVDALIIQDIGLAALIKKAAPEMRLHASTQMSLHNLEGVKKAADLGFSRVVLSRELSREEISYIAQNAPIELEVFVHGALCMSVSGQCYMSAMLGGRSGNRGLCAQPCRLPFSVPGGTGRDLSLKDLSLLENVGELSSMGIASLKIEGRMKRPEYVAAATQIYKKAAEGQTVSQQEYADLQSVFSRSGFTTGYYQAQRGRAMFGSRQYEDVVAAQGVLKKMQAIYEGVEKPRIKVDFKFILNTDQVSLSARDQDSFEANAEGEKPEPAKNKAIDETLVADKLSKTGGTPFLTGDIIAEIEPGLSVPVSEINRLRRTVLDEILEKRGSARPTAFAMPEFSVTDSAKKQQSEIPMLRIRLQNITGLSEIKDTEAEIVFLPVYEIEKNLEIVKQYISKGFRIGAEIPRTLFSEQETVKIKKILAELPNAGVQDALCGNLGAFELVPAGFKKHGGFGLNITNPYAFEEILKNGADDCVLSFEQTLEQLKTTASYAKAQAGIIVYGRLPLMLTRNCPVKNGPGCKNCTGKITDRVGENFPVVCSVGSSEILNTRPVILNDRKDEIYQTGAGFVLFHFTTETPDEIKAALSGWRLGMKPTGSFTRGLYYRGVE